LLLFSKRSAFLSIWRILLAALVFPAGCTRAPNPNAADRFSGLIGASEATLVQRLGSPDKSFDSGGLHYFVYERPDIWRTPGDRPATRFPCRVTFLLDQGHVRMFDREGGGCG
jgi:hypothetical protein